MVSFAPLLTTTGRSLLSSELKILALHRYIVSAPASGMFGGALAYGLLSIEHIGWLTRWRQLFFVGRAETRSRKEYQALIVVI